MDSFRRDGLTFDVRDEGPPDGEPVVLLHGFPQDSTAWARVAPALHQHGLPDCRWTPCYDCGVCTGYALEHVVASAVPPAGGSQGTGQGIDFAQGVPVTLGSTR